MPTARILMLYCVVQSTGTDLGGLAPAFNRLLPTLSGPDVASNPVSAIESVVKAIPDLVVAIDAVRDDPDDLYVTIDSSGGIENAIWPPGQTTKKIRATQSVAPDVTLPFVNSLNLSLWDQDSGFLSSADDHLGSVTITKAEQGLGERAQLASSQVERSAYYVVYRVDA